MTAVISKKITGYRVKTDVEAPISVPPPALQGLHEDVPRPDRLVGSTYKIKSPNSDHAIYIVINDIEIDGQRHPFEMFINSKNMEHFQWIAALTRVVSAVFRKGGDVTFLAEELKAIFDPKGGYFKKGGKYMPSLVAEIGHVLEQHLIGLGLIATEELSSHQVALIAEKKEAAGVTGNEYPDHATVCAACGTKAVIRMDGCDVCLECSASKCG